MSLPAVTPRTAAHGLCANDGGFSLHARVRVHACARRKLEQFCRYAARGPIAQGRLSRTSDGRVLYRFKRPFGDGATHVLLSPQAMHLPAEPPVLAPARPPPQPRLPCAEKGV